MDQSTLPKVKEGQGDGVREASELTKRDEVPKPAGALENSTSADVPSSPKSPHVSVAPSRKAPPNELSQTNVRQVSDRDTGKEEWRPKWHFFYGGLKDMDRLRDVLRLDDNDPPLRIYEAKLFEWRKIMPRYIWTVRRRLAPHEPRTTVNGILFEERREADWELLKDFHR